MKVTVIPNVVGTVPKGLVKELGRRINKRTNGDHPVYHNIKNTTALLRLVRILRRDLET